VVDAASDETTTPEPDLFQLNEPEPPPPPKRSRAMMIAMAVLGVAVIAVGAATGPLAVRILRQKDATLTMPETVANLKRDDSPVAKEHASDLVAILRAQIDDLDSSVGAVYEEPSGDHAHSVMIFGGTTLLWNPERELNTVLKFIDESGEDSLEGLANVDPGELGGVMKCGSTQMDNASMAICGWADHGSIAVALFPGRSTSDAAALMRTLRAATLKR
jgi:hypothetical protein